MRDCFIRRPERDWIVQSQRVTDFAAPFATDFQPEPWQILQTVDVEVTEGILKNIRLVVRLYYAERVAASSSTCPFAQRRERMGHPGHPTAELATSVLSGI